MWIRRPVISKLLHLRQSSMSSFSSFSSSSSSSVVAESAVSELAVSESAEGEAVPLTYLEGFPRPSKRYAETILAIPRTQTGTRFSVKERKAGRVPSILFQQEDGHLGGHKRLISVRINQIKKLVVNLGPSFFVSRLFDLEVRPDFESDEVIEKVRVLPKLLDLLPSTDEVLNVTFIRAPSHALLKVDVPLVFFGEDVSPGLKKGAFLNVMKRKIKFLCPADVIPPYIEVDLSELDVGDKLRMRDLKVHPALKLLRKDPDEPFVKVGASTKIKKKKKSKKRAHK